MATVSPFANKKIIITGASSGIGKASAIHLAKQGAHVILVARREDLLQQLSEDITTSGGNAEWYAADLSQSEEIDNLTNRILENHSVIDVLFNNAGRSIRRPITDSLERFHDFDRCMNINYYAPIRLIRNLLPALSQSESGQIINSSTWGTLLPSPGFGPYTASKVALDTIANTLRLEMKAQGLAVTQIHFPLVHTDMSGATESFKKLPGMTTEQAAEWVEEAVVKRPRAIMNTQTRFGRVLYILFPRLVERISSSSPFSI